MKEKIKDYGQTEKLVFLNTSIITAYGSYRYNPIDLIEVKERIRFAKNKGIEILSAIGHDATAQILSGLTGIDIPVNRIQYEQDKCDLVIVFKLNGRPPEGKILTREEMEEIGYTFADLQKVN